MGITEQPGVRDQILPKKRIKPKRPEDVGRKERASPETSLPTQRSTAPNRGEKVMDKPEENNVLSDSSQNNSGQSTIPQVESDVADASSQQPSIPTT